jgi:hypothetical protein
MFTLRGVAEPIPLFQLILPPVTARLTTTSAAR